MLALQTFIELPEHAAGGFDHGDVHLASGRVFIAHTANGTVDIVDGEGQTFERAVPGCPEASGVLCAQDAGLVFAAARGTGWVLVLDLFSGDPLRRVGVGPKPNGLAWDPGRGHLLVADVEEHSARLLDPRTGARLARIQLPGRPRWAVFDSKRDRFLVNVQAPACVAEIAFGAYLRGGSRDALPGMGRLAEFRAVARMCVFIRDPDGARGTIRATILPIT